MSADENSFTELATGLEGHVYSAEYSCGVLLNLGQATGTKRFGFSIGKSLPWYSSTNMRQLTCTELSHTTISLDLG